LSACTGRRRENKEKRFHGEPSNIGYQSGFEGTNSVVKGVKRGAGETVNVTGQEIQDQGGIEGKRKKNWGMRSIFGGFT